MHYTAGFGKNWNSKRKERERATKFRKKAQTTSRIRIADKSEHQTITCPLFKSVLSVIQE